MLLTGRFRDETLLFRQRRGHDDVRLVEKVSNAPSFATIGQELPEICSFASRTDIAPKSVSAAKIAPTSMSGRCRCFRHARHRAPDNCAQRRECHAMSRGIPLHIHDACRSTRKQIALLTTSTSPKSTPPSSPSPPPFFRRAFLGMLAMNYYVVESGSTCSRSESLAGPP